MRRFYARRSQKRKKIQLSNQYLFTLSGSAGAKAVRRTLMKLSPVTVYLVILPFPRVFQPQQPMRTSPMYPALWFPPDDDL